MSRQLPTDLPPAPRRAFTLIELLVVVAVIAIVGAGVAVFYGGETHETALRQAQIHELAQVRDAFSRFWADNAPTLLSPVATPDTRESLPTAEFLASFAEPREATALYGAMEFFERYGLWPLLAPALYSSEEPLSENFVSFPRFSPGDASGWAGPYISPGRTSTAKIDSIPVPQISGKSGQPLKVLYFEHCRDTADSRETVFCRLILASASAPVADWRPYTGNLRGGSTPFPLDPATGAIAPSTPDGAILFMELLNLDHAAH